MGLLFFFVGRGKWHNFRRTMDSGRKIVYNEENVKSGKDFFVWES